ncbi:MAG: hypothetical protein A2Y78_10165 [Acidobacteria bacterium RBG_13_68_16]|nr:MAG: hypothetical protein A2Y78_10165 [Acidobacteria bacterium RBG_13_68_16]
MTFRNELAGGPQGQITRNTFQSVDYVVGDDGAISGWRLERNGAATFRRVTIGGVAYTVDEFGAATFESLDVNTSITLAGEDLGTILDALPKGIIAYGDSKAWTVDSAAITTTQTIMAEFAWGPALNARYYRIEWDFTIVGTVVGDIFNVDVRYTTDGTAPTTGSAILDGLYDNVRINTTDAAGNRYRLITTYSGVADYDVIRMALTFDRISGTGSGTLLALDDNAAMIVTVEDIGLQVPAVAAGSLSQKSKSAGAPDPDPLSTYVKTYSATWSRSWTGSDATYETNGTLAQGYNTPYPSNGNMKSWIGFDHAQIAADLTGATVRKVEVYLYYWHWYATAGGTAVIGYHNSTATSAPAYDPSKDAVAEKLVASWPRNAGKWVDVSTAGAFTLDGWRTGAHRGIALGPGPSTSTTYYGKAYGNTEPNEPKLRITYEK